MTDIRSRLRGRAIVTALLASALMVGIGPAAVAQDATPVGDAPMFAPPAGCEVFASGLFNPRYLAIDEQDNVYVTEAGDGGDEAFLMPEIAGTPAAEPEASPAAEGEGMPAPGDVLTMYGPTGQVSMITQDGEQSVVATGLPSHTFGTEVVGPAGIAVSEGTIYVAVGGPGPATALVPPVEFRDQVVAIDAASGEITTVADIGEYERTQNPDPNAVDSNLYGMTMGSDGLLYVADAGGNTVYTVDPASGELTALAVIPGVPMEEFQNPARGGAEEIDPVPTGLAPAQGGGVILGQLTGGPFPQGAASIYKVGADGSVSQVATGMTMVTGVAIGPGGQIYVAQISEDFLSQPPAAGSIVKIGAFNQPYPVLGGLPIPNDVKFDSQGNMYVVIFTTAPAGTPPGGMVLKCDLDALEGGAAPEGGEEATPVAAITTSRRSL